MDYYFIQQLHNSLSEGGLSPKRHTLSTGKPRCDDGHGGRGGCRGQNSKRSTEVNKQFNLRVQVSVCEYVHLSTVPLEARGGGQSP